ncbi:hypothetical protein D3C76_1602390 [compost metagenome]
MLEPLRAHTYELRLFHPAERSERFAFVDPGSTANNGCVLASRVAALKEHA